MPSPFGFSYTQINATADGDNTVIAAQAGKVIRVISYVLTSTATGAVLVKDGAGTVLARFNPAVNGGAAFAGGVDAPAFETASGQSLVINNAAGIDTIGHIGYVVI
jgi:hypothetical protein